MEIGSWQRQDRLHMQVKDVPLEMFDGNIVFAMCELSAQVAGEIEIAIIDANGENLSQHSLEFEPNVTFLVPHIALAPDNGFWFYGRLLGFIDTPPVNVLTWFTSDAVPGIDEYIDTGLPVRDNLDTPVLWVDEEGSYRTVTSQQDGFRQIVFSEQGEAITPLEGEQIQGAPLGKHYDLQGERIGDTIYYIWRAERTSNTAKLASFSLEGEYNWTISIEREFNLNQRLMDDYFTLTLLEDEDALLVGGLDAQTPEITPYLLKINAENGEIIWNIEHQTQSLEGAYFHVVNVLRAVEYIDGFIYDSFYPESGELRVHKLTTAGENVWEEPVAESYPLNNIGIGMVAAPADGVYLGFCRNSGDSLMAWLKEVTAVGEFGDSLSFFSNYLQIEDGRGLDGPNNQLLRSGDNIWLSGTGDYLGSNGVVQGLNENGELLLGENGYRPPDQFGETALLNGGSPDGTGGLWLLYYYPVIKPYYGAPIAEWISPDGNEISEPVLLGSDPHRASLISYSVADNGDLMTVSRHATPDIRHFRESRSNYDPAYSLQRIQHPDNLSTPDETPFPEEFSLSAAYPNPFNSVTIISYSAPVASHISLKLYNLAGREVETLVNERHKAGVHSRIVNADNLSSGLYFVRLEAEDQVLNRKIVLIK